MSDTGVYVIKNLVNGKVYIGSTDTNFNHRFNEHKCRLRNNYHGNNHLQNAWNKYGEDNFEFYPLARAKDNISSLEQKFVNFLFDNYDYQDFYNIAKDVDKPMLGRSQSEEAKRKLSESKKGKERSEKVKQKISEKLTKEHFDIECESCGNIFEVKPSRKDSAKYCSQSCKGRGISKSKLNEDEVIKIKKLLKEDNLSYKKISEKFSITSAMVRHIDIGRAWNHIKLS